MDSVTLRFHRSLYHRAGIDRAVERFSPLGSFVVTEHEHDVRVVVTPARASIAERLPHELANHALVESIREARRG